MGRRTPIQGSLPLKKVSVTMAIEIDPDREIITGDFGELHIIRDTPTWFSFSRKDSPSDSFPYVTGDVDRVDGSTTVELWDGPGKQTGSFTLNCQIAKRLF
jgi:hypothetical protein